MSSYLTENYLLRTKVSTIQNVTFQNLRCLEMFSKFMVSQAYQFYHNLNGLGL